MQKNEEIDPYLLFSSQFMIDSSQSVFKLEPTCGFLPGKGSQNVIVHFTPTCPINYYRRVTCLVQNQVRITHLTIMILCFSFQNNIVTVTY